MNCEKCQELISDLIDGSLKRQDELLLTSHLEQCLDCANVRTDLESIVGFCRTHQGEYDAPPNERALWLRIRNILESENQVAAAVTGAAKAPRKSSFGWLSRSWEISLAQLAAAVAAIVMVVSLTTAVFLRRVDVDAVTNQTRLGGPQESSSLTNRTWQQQQAINYWNQRVELNKARWSQDMRDTFERNLQVIDQAVNNSLSELNRNPHDEVSEEMLNAALNEKLALLKEFADL
jgi:hypothetical protein